MTAYDIFMAAHGYHIALFLLGVLACIAVWWIKHPQDFIEFYDDDPDPMEEFADSWEA